jgi:hypothetical protein
MAMTFKIQHCNHAAGMGAIKAGTLVVERAGEECNGFVSSRMRK